ncbi:MAG: hypothetical protein QG577_321 [Thermodesulfobacteriota bacterium]|nr:hypothetical protein [Thermodesulfobacteriota bacterium]
MPNVPRLGLARSLNQYYSEIHKQFVPTDGNRFIGSRIDRGACGKLHADRDRRSV